MFSASSSNHLRAMQCCEMSKHKTKKIYNSSKQQGWANSDSKLLADNHVYVASDVLTRLPQFIRPRHY